MAECMQNENVQNITRNIGDIEQLGQISAYLELGKDLYREMDRKRFTACENTAHWLEWTDTDGVSHPRWRMRIPVLLKFALPNWHCVDPRLLNHQLL